MTRAKRALQQGANQRFRTCGINNQFGASAAEAMQFAEREAMETE